MVIFVAETVILGLLTLLATLSGLLVMLENRKSIISKAVVYLMVLGAIPFLLVARILSCFIKQKDNRTVSIVESDSIPNVHSSPATRNEPVLIDQRLQR